MYYITLTDYCGSAPSVAMTCMHGHVYAKWNSSGCSFDSCVASLNCTNGTDHYVKKVSDFMKLPV